MRTLESRRLLRHLLGIAGILALLYLIAGAYLFFCQASFIFQPHEQVQFTPKDFGCEYRGVWIVNDGERLQAYVLPAPRDSTGRTLLYLHGNHGNIGDNAAHACRLRHLGFRVVLFDYRGYGNSSGGPPRENTLYADADAAFAHVVSEMGVPAPDIVLYGHSLGGAVAVEVALRHPQAAGLIAESTFTSIVEMGRHRRGYNLFPLKWMITEKFASREKVDDIRMPKLFIHGKRDEVVPARMTKALFKAASEPKRLLLVPEGRHDNSALAGGSVYRNAVERFVEQLEKSHEKSHEQDS